MTRVALTLSRGFAALAAAALLGGVLTVTAVPAAASDAPPGSFEIDYDVAGSTTIVKPDSTVVLGPAVSKTYISDSGDGTFTADVALPQTSSTFAILGLVPVSAQVDFIPAGPLTGAIGEEPPVRLTATARYYVKLSNVTAAGLPTFVGDTCVTKDPVTIPLATPPGEAFDLTTGGTLAGTYSIGEFADCGLTTALVNLLVPGPDNTIALQLSNGRFVE